MSMTAVESAIGRVKAGEVDAHRHESYVRLHQEHRKLADMYWWGIEEEG